MVLGEEDDAVRNVRLMVLLLLLLMMLLVFSDIRKF